jgi:hypothetical protein
MRFAAHARLPAASPRPPAAGQKKIYRALHPNQHRRQYLSRLQEKPR